MQRREDLQHASQYRREATVCASAARAAAAPEVKRAYLELEQAWLSLAPKVEIRDEDSIEPTAPPDEMRDTSHVPKKKRR
jgi:hypothetical protein